MVTSRKDEFAQCKTGCAEIGSESGDEVRKACGAWVVLRRRVGEHGVGSAAWPCRASRVSASGAVADREWDWRGRDDAGSGWRGAVARVWLGVQRGRPCAWMRLAVVWEAS